MIRFNIQDQNSINIINQTFDSHNSSNETSLLEGDEELLIMDNSRLGFTNEIDSDFCRCTNCQKNQIAIISSNHTFATQDIFQSDFEPSITQENGLINNMENGLNHHRHDNESEHNWSNHCHPLDENSIAKSSSKRETKKLVTATILCTIFMFVEFILGYWAGSSAVMTDATHLLSDLASFILSIFAVWISDKPPTKKMSFGFHRAEVLGAVASVFMIWFLTGILVYVAIIKIISNDFQIDADMMIIIAGSGVAVNIIMGIILSENFFGCSDSNQSHGHSHGLGHGHSHGLGHGHSHGHSHENMNVRAALIHVFGDLLQSVGVLIAAYIIKYAPSAKIVDPICTFIFSILIVFTTFNIMKDAVLVLMEGFPSGFDYNSIKKSLESIDGVKTSHSLHIWSLTLNKNALAVHLAIGNHSDVERILRSAERLIRKEYHIDQTTIQVEIYDPSTMLSCNTCRGP